MAVWYRSSIRALLRGPIKRWRVGPGGAEFEYWDQSLGEVREQLPEEAADRAQDDDEQSELVRELKPLLDVSPRAAVLEAFIRVENLLQRAVLADPPLVDPGRVKTMSATRLAGVALDHGRIGGHLPGAIAGLSVLRNVAAHEPDGVDAEQAREFILTVDAVLYALANGSP